MLFVPIGYKSKALMNLDEIHGGSPYGSFVFSHDDLELILLFQAPVHWPEAEVNGNLLN